MQQNRDSILQKIIGSHNFDDLPTSWQNFDLKNFSNEKKLLPFQKEGLKNALIALWFYFCEKKARKTTFYQFYKNNQLENLDYNLKTNKKDKKKFSVPEYLTNSDYSKDYPVENQAISFAYFINRMSFSMATGSGKTLLIVKLIAFLGELMHLEELPKKDLLFLVQREDLLQQFQKHIAEFNSDNGDNLITLKNLKDYANHKYSGFQSHSKEITVYYYRYDLISDEAKETIIDFKDYDNHGNWFVLLDEAHKGEKSNSKRQLFYSILSRNGFLFNFSATFTDRQDFATCVFDFNLSKFISEGYSKHIYLAQKNLTGFEKKRDFDDNQKQQLILKCLLTFCLISQCSKKIKIKLNRKLYHNPLLLAFVNSVNAPDSDLKLFFVELVKIAKNKIQDNLLLSAKAELATELKSGVSLTFEDNKTLKFETQEQLNIIENLDYQQILECVFNSKGSGDIELLRIPNNKKELLLKLKTTEKPFALIKIGDKDRFATMLTHLEQCESNESFENQSYFKEINKDDSSINLLLGSRSFYEGWDSSRPNLLLFINIGTGNTNSQKFVLQAIGRGLRVEPIENKRKRLMELHNESVISQDNFEKIKDFIDPLETLFIYGSNAENLQNIVQAVNSEEQNSEKSYKLPFIINPKIKGQNLKLLVPVYKTGKSLAEDPEKETYKYDLSNSDFKIAQMFSEKLSEKTILLKYNCNPKTVSALEKFFAEEYSGKSEARIDNPELILSRLITYLETKNKVLDSFTYLPEKDLVHFKEISFRGSAEKLNLLKRKIEFMQDCPNQKENLEKAEIEAEKIDDKKEYHNKMKEIEALQTLFETAGKFKYNEYEPQESDNKKSDNDADVSIKYLAEHYYLPLLISNKEKLDYLKHIIDVASEKEFIDNLIKYLKKENFFSKLDWWFFAKIDEHLDNIYIPYNSGQSNKKFFPDFIFWGQKQNNYLILFIDPKGIEHTASLKKIDGYEDLFIKNKQNHKFENLNITTKLLFWNKNNDAASEKYKSYWFNSFEDFDFDKTLADFESKKKE